MTRHFTFVCYLVATLCTEMAFGQFASAQVALKVPKVAPGSPIAYLYVSSSPSSGKNEINAYSVSTDGALTVIAGSPLAANVQYMAANGKYLFGSNGTDIDSFSIQSNGALKEEGTINAQAFNTSDCGGPFALFFDRGGTTLYDLDLYSDCANNAYQFFDIAGSQGRLNYLGMTSASSPVFDVPLSFIGNNQYAYGSLCYQYDPRIFGFQRGSDGALTFTNFNAPIPDAPSGGFYCPNMAAADSTNHVVVPLEPFNSDWEPSGQTRLATYTADSSGNLTSASTASNMPTTLVTNKSNSWVADISISPSGELLAVAGAGGLQIFHFNGANPITHYSGLLTTDAISQLSWDSANHLYAISQTSGKLFVFSVTPTKVSQVTGSPHSISSPLAVVVVAK
jgi:6-phosphogluconolactonase (cycloisomerase 2 family)